MYAYQTFDYSLIYNVDTGDWNTLPQKAGTYRFIHVGYVAEDGRMMVTEYEIDYVP